MTRLPTWSDAGLAFIELLDSTHDEWNTQAPVVWERLSVTERKALIYWYGEAMVQMLPGWAPPEVIP